MKREPSQPGLEPIVKLEQEEIRESDGGCLALGTYIDDINGNSFSDESDKNLNNIEDQDYEPIKSKSKICPKSPGEKQIPCDICGQSLKTEKALVRHKFKVHKTKTESTENILKDPKKFSCEHDGCSEVFQLRKLLWSHMMSEHGVDMSAENKERYNCSECGKKCLSKHDLEKHGLKHTNQKNFVCMECGKQFKGEGGLKVHMKRHQGIFDNKCDDCDAAYTSASALNAHRLAKHTPGHSFMCSECGQAFKYQNALDKHKTKHTGEKRYQCRYCEKRFRLFGIRANHERVHRGIKEFQCSMCPKQFMQQDQLRVHIKRHLNQRDHVCQACGKAFIEPVGLRKHQCSGKPAVPSL